jgi:phenylacetate-CoA ligase
MTRPAPAYANWWRLILVRLIRHVLVVLLGLLYAKSGFLCCGNLINLIQQNNRDTMHPTQYAMNEAALSITEIEAMQESAWNHAFHYSAERSPFYRRHFLGAGISPRDNISLAEISHIPTIDKNVVSENAEEFLCVPREKIVDIVTTSGSTGRPLVWQLTESDLERLARNEALSFACAGFAAADTVLLAVAMDRCFIAGMAYFLGLRKLGCAVVRVGPATPAIHLDMIGRVKPTAVVSVPSFLAHLGNKAEAAKFNLANYGIRKAVCIGEPVRENNFSLNCAGRLVEKNWGAKVFSTYGVTELAASLCECEFGLGGHLHPELLFLEVLDEAGNHVPDGEVGELTATTFGVEAMPLIRYRTGDFAMIHRSPCSCGRRSLRIGPVVGRKNQKLKLKGTTIFPSAFKAILDATPEIISYAIVARRENNLADAVEVKIACASDAAKISATLKERFQGEAKVIPQITVASVAEIEKLQLPDCARKRCYFVDLRN